MRKQDKAKITLTFRHGHSRYVKSGRATITLRTRRPRRVAGPRLPRPYPAQPDTTRYAMTLKRDRARRVLTFGSLAGFIVGDGGTAVAAGSAGTYTITACSPSTSAGAWTSVNQAPAGMSEGNDCGPGTPTIGPNNAITDTGALYGEDSSARPPRFPTVTRPDGS